MAKAKVIKDDKFYVKKSDIDAIRRRPTMIIGSLNAMGVFHLCKEIIDNNRDECIKPNSPGNKITITITDDCLISRDNGRGIPTDMLRVIHETSQAGSSMTRSNGATSGENGIGSTAFTALSSFLEVTTLRPSEKKKLTIRYREGEFVEEILEDYNGTDSGLITTFKPSKEVLNTDKIPIKLLRKWLHEFDYTLPDGIVMDYSINGREYHGNHRPLKDYLSDPEHEINIPEDARLGETLEFECGGELVETVLGKSYDRSFKLDVVIAYSDPEKYRNDDIVMSWMNMIHTKQNGDHVNSVIKGYSRFIREKVLQKNKKYDNLKQRDIEAHMSILVRGTCDCANMFSAQSKATVESDELKPVIEEATYEALCKKHSGIINDLVDIVIGNYRARVEGEKLRNVSSTSKGLKSWQKPDSYYPAASIKTEQPKELFLVEGNSAGGGLKGARNAKFQAILTFRGKSLNVWDLDIERVMKSEVWVNLIKVLGCGIGPTFDIRKLNFDKIIISTDADIDGYHIRVGFIAFFTKFMPEIIEQGKLYIAEPPLYKLVRGKEVSYVASQVEYTEACINSLGNISIGFPEKKIDKVNSKAFVKEAFDYRSQLEKASINRATNPYLLEHIAHCFAMSGDTIEAFEKNVDKWIRSLANVFPELGYDHNNHQLKGVIDLRDQLVLIDQDLIDQLRYVIDVQRSYGILVLFKTPGSTEAQTTTLAKFFEYSERLYPASKARYKGLGSSSAQVSREVIMDPATRRLVRVRLDKDTMRTMPTLVGKGADDIKARKEMLMNFKFTIEDIDN